MPRTNAPAHLGADLVDALRKVGYALAPPISRKNLERLTRSVGVLPQGLMDYLSTSDGLELPGPDLIPTEFRGVAGFVERRASSIFSSKSMLDFSVAPWLPLRSDQCGNYDAVIVKPGPGFGAVFFYDHDTPESRFSHLLASSVVRYLEFWCASCLADPAEPEDRRWPDNERWLRSHDPEAALLLDDPAFRPLIAKEREYFHLAPAPSPPPEGQPLPKGARVGVNPFTGEKSVMMPLERWKDRI